MADTPAGYKPSGDDDLTKGGTTKEGRSDWLPPPRVRRRGECQADLMSDVDEPVREQLLTWLRNNPADLVDVLERYEFRHFNNNVDGVRLWGVHCRRDHGDNAGTVLIPAIPDLDNAEVTSGTTFSVMSISATQEGVTVARLLEDIFDHESEHH